MHLAMLLTFFNAITLKQFKHQKNEKELLQLQ